MFRILCDPSSWSSELCLTEIIRGVSQVQKLRCQHRPSTRQNICEPLPVIPVKHSSVLPDDGSHKIRNMSEWFLILCLLNFYTTWILNSMFCITECISRIINVTDRTYCLRHSYTQLRFITIIPLYIQIKSCIQTLSKAHHINTYMFKSVAFLAVKKSSLVEMYQHSYVCCCIVWMDELMCQIRWVHNPEGRNLH
jgi:hypothetical protein